jgi:hypothetical protein
VWPTLSHSHSSPLLGFAQSHYIEVTQGGVSSTQRLEGTLPIHEIFADMAQLLVVVEKLSCFESAILKFFLQNKFFFASFP